MTILMTLGCYAILVAVLVQILKTLGRVHALERDLQTLSADVARECYTLEELCGRHPSLSRKQVVECASEHGLSALSGRLEYPNGNFFSN